MCMEDIRIGNRKYAKKTVLPIGAFVVFPADSRRVLIRVTPNRNLVRLWAENTDLDPPVIFLNGDVNAEELSIETHGNMVRGKFVASASVAAAGVTEVFLDDQQNPPPIIN